MTTYEKAEIRRLPKKYRPLGAVSIVFRSIFYAIPVLGWIFLIAHAASSKNICRRSFARAYLFGLIVTLLVVGVASVLILVAKVIPMETIKNTLIDLINKIPA